MRLITTATIMALLAGPALAQTAAPAPAPGADPIEPRRDPVDARADPSAGWNCEGLLPRTAAAGQPRQIAVDELEDEDVYNLRGEELGEIENVVMGEDNQVFAVVEFRGSLGIGEEKRLVPLRAIVMREDRVYMPCVTEGELKALAAWRSGDAPYRELEDAFLTQLEVLR